MKIAILDDWQGVALSMADWTPLDAEITALDVHEPDPDALSALIPGTEVLCVMRERTPITAALMDRLPDLGLIVTTGPANVAIDLPAARERRITVCGTRGSGAATAELAFGLILNMARMLPAQLESTRAGGWQAGVGGDLAGKTLGVLGLGRLGRRMTDYGRAFGMEVIAWSTNLTAQVAADHGARLVERETLFREADHVSVHLKLSDRSRGLVGAAEIATMKPTATLTNTARAPIVDVDALVAALREGRLAAAALDVFDVEPLPADDPLRTVPNLLLTPHVGYVTQDTYAMFYSDTVDAIRAWAAGAPIRMID